MQQTMSSFRVELLHNQEQTVKGHQESLPCYKGHKRNEKQHHFNELMQYKMSLIALHVKEASTNAAALSPTVTPTSTTVPTSTTTLESLVLICSICSVASSGSSRGRYDFCQGSQKSNKAGR